MQKNSYHMLLKAVQGCSSPLKHLLTMLQWHNTTPTFIFLAPRAVNDDGSVMYHAPYCFIHDWYKVNPSSRRCERKLRTLYADTRSLMARANGVEPDKIPYYVMWNISVWNKDHPDAYKWIEANGQWLYDNFDHCDVETSDDDDDARSLWSSDDDEHFDPFEDDPTHPDARWSLEEAKHLMAVAGYNSRSLHQKQTNQRVRPNYKFDSHQLPASQVEHLVSLSLPSDLPRHCLAQGYTHIHFGAIRLALTFHGRKGLPAYSRIALLNTRFVEYQHACIGTIQTTLNAGTIFVTFYPNFNIPLNDPSLLTALKAQIHIGGTSQVNTFQATFHYQMAYRVQNHSLDILVPGQDNAGDALMIDVYSNATPTCTYVPRQLSRDELSENVVAQNKVLVKILSQQGMITNSQEYLSSRVRSLLKYPSTKLLFKIQELHREIIQIIRTSPRTQPSSSISQKEAEMKNLKNQLQDLEWQHKQKRITSLIDDPWRLPSTPFVDYEEFDNVDSFEHLFMAEPENAESTVQFDAEDYEEHQENLNQETPTEFPKFDIKQYFTFDDVPPSKWRERSIEMLTWCTAELQYYTIDIVIKRFLTRLQGRLRDWYHSLGEYRQLQIQQSISPEAFMSTIYSEFIGSPWEHTTHAREEFLKMKCCSFQKKDLEKHYDRMSQRFYCLNGVDDVNLKQVFLNSFPESHWKPEAYRL
ncbi:putative zinc finger, CCHC-type containing protein [Tanacetum coccineum]